MTKRVPFAGVPKGVIASMTRVENSVAGTGLDPKTLELVRLRVSRMNRCVYCWNRLARSLGFEATSH